ncbi:DUF6538 domain-containing protein [Azospirillum sp. Marseille-Q6669]
MLTRQGATFHFRRRVPGSIRPLLQKGEIWTSLRTTDRRTARATAAGLYALTEDAFATMAEKPAQDPLAAAEELKAMLDEYVQLRRENVAATIMLIGQHSEARANAETMRELALAAISGGARVDPPPQPPPPPAAPPSPLFSSLEEEFLADRSRPSGDHPGYTAQTVSQARATFRLWLELVGDLPVREYTREQAGEFRKLLLRLPATFGKTGGGARKPAMDEIKRIEGTGAECLSMKTVKRHFSALNQYFGWLKERGHVSEIVTTGFKFPLGKRGRSARDDWSAEDLRILFHSSRYAPNADRTTAEWWLPLIALHSGLRLEEICRLRPGPEQDLQVLHGVPCFVIQPHPDGWDPKTEAGERLVPVHSTLVELGLLDLVERRRREGAARLFPELRPYGEDGKLGHEYSRQFSRFKIGLGVREKTVFHSFRHTVRTLIDGADLQERWLDALMGHEGAGAGVGRRVYNKRTDVERLRQLVEAIRPEVDLSHLRRA